MKHVKEEWLKAFPNLCPTGSNKFFEILGPMIVGIELVKLSYGDEYRPYMVVSSFWNTGIIKNKLESDFKRRISTPNIYSSLTHSDGRGFNIGYYDTSLIKEASSQIKERFLPLGQNVSINTFFNYLDFYKDSSKQAQTSAGEARLLEFKYLVAKYSDDENLSNQIMQCIETGRKVWDMEHFEKWIGNYDAWVKKLENISRNELLDVVNKFKLNSQIKKLHDYKLMIN
ncbi:hypothetical protein WJN01_06745 [Flavobacteriaceae bacterium SZ-1-7]|uniref:hypothetical protein n=1 Tax=Tamlana sedimenti TaxID=3134126 RepID=UPI003129008C